MKIICEQLQKTMLAYVKGEVAPLEKAKMETHLGHCTNCNLLREDLALALSSAQSWDSSLSEAQLNYRVARLAPYIETQTSWFVQSYWQWASRLALVATAATLLLVTTWWSYQWLNTDEKRSALSVMATSTNPMSSVRNTKQLKAQTPVLARLSPYPFLRMVYEDTWDGDISGNDMMLLVHLRKGAVALSFAGNGRRQIRVQTPQALVQVVGTKFSVEVHNQVTTVRVSEGTVKIKSNGESREIHAGESQSRDKQTWLKDQGTEVGAQLLEDDYLKSHVVLDFSQYPIRARAWYKKIEKEVALSSAELGMGVLSQLDKAEQLVFRQQYEAALTIYNACVESTLTAYDAYRDLCRLEKARIIGFEQKNTDHARQLLMQLINSGHGEVKRQAQLGLCELRLKSEDFCGARNCLESLKRSHLSDQGVSHEVRRLLKIWQLEILDCSRTETNRLEATGLE